MTQYFKKCRQPVLLFGKYLRFGYSHYFKFIYRNITILVCVLQEIRSQTLEMIMPDNSTIQIELRQTRDRSDFDSGFLRQNAEFLRELFGKTIGFFDNSSTKLRQKGHFFGKPSTQSKAMYQTTRSILKCLY